MMKVIKSVTEMQKTAEMLRQKNRIIALVPTMGYLHEGHLSLIRLAREKADIVIVSIFVNPAQFGPGEDFNQYPRDAQHDEKLCRREKTDYIFYPDKSDMYRKDHKTWIITDDLAEKLCGITRPTHFRGVTTIVAKLFNITKPHYAVFGQKDAQQAIILKRMVHDLNFDLQMIIAPIVREADGLALSSRNKYLNTQERSEALVLFKSLMEAEKLIKNGENRASKIFSRMNQILNSAGHVRTDYIKIVDFDNLEDVDQIGKNTLIAVAVFLGKTRLIDNIVI